MKYVFSLLWAFLIGAAVSYILASMANEPFNTTLLAIFTAVIFLAVVLIDLALGSDEKQSDHS
ncbi:MAG TPA: DUF2929 family protein [Pseudogracilibacillus sp.]|nr:DUF2929 family protein [Pseudogracilibacillus sp.]